MVDCFRSGQLDVLVFPSGGYRKNEYVLKVGRWKLGGGKLHHSEYVPMDELPDLFRALSQLEKSSFWKTPSAQLCSIPSRRRG